VNLLRKFTQFFSYEKIAGDRKGFFLFSFSSKRKEKKKTKISCGRVNYACGLGWKLS